jgi:F-type H+-transporting ATPase subunit delta
MKNLRVARLYAMALMITADEEKNLDQVSTDVDLLDGLLRDSREFRLLLVNPVISAARKTAAVKALLEQRVSRGVLTFLLLMAQKGREALLPEIIEQFRALRDQRLGIVDVQVRSATELEDSHCKALEDRLKRYTRKKIRMQVRLDPSLKGGLVIQIGDTVLDSSVTHQLEVLRHRFLAGETGS